MKKLILITILSLITFWIQAQINDSTAKPVDTVKPKYERIAADTIIGIVFYVTDWKKGITHTSVGYLIKEVYQTTGKKSQIINNERYFDGQGLPLKNQDILLFKPKQ